MVKPIKGRTVIKNQRVQKFFSMYNEPYPIKLKFSFNASTGSRFSFSSKNESVSKKLRFVNCIITLKKIPTVAGLLTLIKFKCV